jgi:hypothetical protein
MPNLTECIQFHVGTNFPVQEETLAMLPMEVGTKLRTAAQTLQERRSAMFLTFTELLPQQVQLFEETVGPYKEAVVFSRQGLATEYWYIGSQDHATDRLTLSDTGVNCRIIFINNGSTEDHRLVGGKMGFSSEEKETMLHLHVDHKDYYIPGFPRNTGIETGDSITSPMGSTLSD